MLSAAASARPGAPMLESAILVIVVAAGEAGGTATAGLLAALEGTLGAGASVQVVESGDPSDDAVLGAEDQLHARAAGSLIWEDAARLRARVRVHVAQADRWTDRVLKFSPADTPRERGRAIGLAIATMWSPVAATRGASPEASDARERASPVGESPPRALSSPPSPSQTPAAAAARAGGANEEVSRERSAGRGHAAGSHALGIAAVGSTGVMGSAAGLGVALDGARFLGPRFSIRVGLALRGGPVPELPGTDYTASAGAGVEWWGWPPSSARRLGLGVRADVLLIRHQVFATTAEGGTESYGRFVPGADLVPQVALVLARDVEAVGGVGAELAFGSTGIEAGMPLAEVATIPPLRLVGQVGLRFRF
jgi:hypothetical protein